MSQTRIIGGVVFECVRAGLWITPDRRYAIVEQMHGRLEHEWLLFRTNLHELSKAAPVQSIDDMTVEQLLLDDSSKQRP